MNEIFKMLANATFAVALWFGLLGALGAAVQAGVWALFLLGVFVLIWGEFLSAKVKRDV